MLCANCRAPLTAGSRYCNACGAAVAAPAPPGGDRTGAYTGQTLQGRPTPHPSQTVMPPTYQMPSGTPYPGSQIQAPPAGNKKPIALLAALLLLITSGVAAGTFFLVRKPNQAVTGGKVTQVPVAPGVQQASGTAAPSAPGVMSLPGGRPPAPGQPVTGAVPKPTDPNMAPNVMMAPGSAAPTGSSVTQVTGVQTPTAPAVIAAPNQPIPAGPSAVAAPNRPTPKPEAPAVVDNSDLDRYIRWLQYVEQERQGLRAMGETESFRMIDGFYQAALGLADPDSNDAVIQQQFNQNLMVTLNRAVAASRMFRTNIMRTKPAVPSDCKALDQYYMAAMDEESTQTVALLDALVRKDIGRIKQIGRTAAGRIDKNLGMANLRLEQTYRGRGLNQQFRIETGGNSSMLGGLMGMGGMGGF